MRSKVESALEQFKQKNILIIGDLMLDEFVRGIVERISPEAPVPVVNVRKIYHSAGGAGNVAMNLKSIGVNAIISGVVGNDEHGKQLLDLFRNNGIDTRGIIVNNAASTILKQRIIAHSQQVVRIDYEERNDLDADRLSEIMDKIDKIKDGIDAVIISDYGKGMITSDLLAQMQILQRSGKKIIIDPKKRNYNNYRNASLITPNETEASAASGLEIEDDASLNRVAEELVKKWDCGAVLITRGSKGLALLERGKKVRFIKTFAQDVYDVTGAGDTVISLFTAGLVSGLDYYESAVLSNVAAGIVVSKVGTSTVTIEEIRDGLELWRKEIKY